MAAGAQEAEDAKTAIEAEGRAITLVQLATTPADTAKPWRGNAGPRTTPLASMASYGLFVQPSSSTALGYRIATPELLKRADQVCIIGAGSDWTGDIEDFDEIIDTDNSRWKIVHTEKLQPSEFPILFYLWLQR